MHRSVMADAKIPAAAFFLGSVLSAFQPSFAQSAASLSQTAAAAPDSSMKLDDGTPLALRTKQVLSSSTAKIGDRVPFRVTEDVKAGDLLVIPRGAEAWGVVTAVQKKRRKGKPGSVDVAIQSVQLLNGDTAPLRAENHLAGTDKTGQMADAMDPLQSELLHDKGWPVSEVFALPIMALMPLFLLEKGGDVRLPAGTKVTAYLNGDVPLDRTAYERVQPTVIRAAGPATVTIFRENIRYGSTNKPSVYCGRIALARLPSGGYLKIQLPRGKYSLRSNDEQAVELQLEDGQEVYLRMQIVIHGFSVKGHLARVINGDGEDEIASLRELSSNDVAKIADINLADLQATPQKK